MASCPNYKLNSSFGGKIDGFFQRQIDLLPFNQSSAELAMFALARRRERWKVVIDLQ